MLVSYDWLKEFVEIPVGPELLAEKLTMAGFEVEGLEQVDGDTVFEVNITPNRPDCLSTLGIAREVSAIFRLPMKLPDHQLKSKQPVSDFTIQIINPELCNRYTGRFIEDVTIAESPDWMKSRLERCGIRSINNIVDITNYVLLEFGHPLHAFDADMLDEKTIKVQTAGKGQKIVTLDETERELPEDVLLIWDSKRPVAIAGVMGGLNTEVTEKTHNVFLESAHFTPFSIRRTSKTLSLVSESSYRFERGVDIVFLEHALNRAALLIQDIAGGKVHEIIDAYPVRYKAQPVEVMFSRINSLLGTNLSDDEMIGIMSRLGIPSEIQGGKCITYPPSNRRDLQRNTDIAEEIARIYGYENIPTTTPKSPLSSGEVKKRPLYMQKIRHAMRKSGFLEVINYSFMNMESLDNLHITDNDTRRQAVPLSNPLSQDSCLMRTTLLPTLIENLKYNAGRGNKNIRLFEMAKVFEHTGDDLPSEDFRLGGIFYEENLPALWKDEAEGFFIVKGALEALFEELKINGCEFSLTDEPFLHTGKAADIIIANEKVGYAGVLIPEIVETFQLKKRKPEVIVFEIRVDKLLTFVSQLFDYHTLPKYPFVERDIAIVLDESVPSVEIQKIILSYPSELIEEVSLFDFYKGSHIPAGKKSLAFNIIYRSKEKTLTDEEVEDMHSKLVRYILEKTGGSLRTS